MFTVTTLVLKLKEIETLAKTMKSELIYINDYHQVFGISAGLSVYQMIRNAFVDFPVPVILNVLELKNLLTTKILSDSITIQWGPQYSALYTDIESKLFYKNSIDHCISTIDKIISTTPVSFSRLNLQNDEDFQRIINSPATKGNGFYKLDDKYIMSLHKGMLPLNKSDIVSVEIRDINSREFLATFDIVKKKNIVIQNHVKYLNLYN